MQILLVSLFQFLCSVSFQSLTLCLLLWATLSGNLKLLPLFMLIDAIPALLTYKLAGRLLDTFEKSKIMKIAPFITFVYIAAMGFIYRGNIVSLEMALGLCALGVSVYKGFYQPLILSIPVVLQLKAAIPLRKVNSCIQASEQLGRVFGFLIAGIFTSQFNIENSFWLLSFAFLTIFLVSILVKLKPKMVNLDKFSISNDKASNYFRSNPSVKFFMTKVVLFNFLLTPFIVFFSLYAKNLSFTSAQTGIFLSTYAFGQLSLFLYFYIKPPMLNAQTLMKISFLLAGICQTGFFWSTTYFEILVNCYLLGLAISCANLTLTTCLQKKIPLEIQGQIVGTLKTYSNLLMPLGYISAGLFVSNNSNIVPILYLSCGLAILLLSIIYSQLNLYKEFFHGELNIRN